MQADGQATPTLLNLLNFLYELNLAFELGRLAIDPRYESFKFTRDVALVNSPRARPLSDEDRLRIRSLRVESPLNLELIAGAVVAAPGVIWVLMQIVDKIANFPLNRRKLAAEVEKLERENDQARIGKMQHGDLSSPEALESRLRQRGAYSVYESSLKRLERSGFRLEGITFTIVTDDDGESLNLRE